MQQRETKEAKMAGATGWANEGVRSYRIRLKRAIQIGVIQSELEEIVSIENCRPWVAGVRRDG